MGRWGVDEKTSRGPGGTPASQRKEWMPGQQKHLLIARDHYDDVETAVKELGTLWVLDLINKTLEHSKIARERLREKRKDKD